MTRETLKKTVLSYPFFEMREEQLYVKGQLPTT